VRDLHTHLELLLAEALAALPGPVSEVSAA
jgi:hypothetical protein